MEFRCWLMMNLPFASCQHHSLHIALVLIHQKIVHLVGSAFRIRHDPHPSLSHYAWPSDVALPLISQLWTFLILWCRKGLMWTGTGCACVLVLSLSSFSPLSPSQDCSFFSNCVPEFFQCWSLSFFWIFMPSRSLPQISRSSQACNLHLP